MTSVFPFFIIFLNHFPDDKIFLFKNPSLLVTVITILSLIARIILENIGSLVEVRCFDKKNIILFKNYNDTWEKFLMLNYDGKEPSGHRYVRNILMRMKFELSFGFALIPLGAGLVILDCQHVLVTSFLLKIILFYLIPLLGSIYFLKEAYDSSLVLAKTRQLLVNKYYI